MFSPNTLYDYLRYKYNWPKNNIKIRNMYPNGVMNIQNLISCDLSAQFSNIPHQSNIPPTNIPPIKYLGYCELLDQEPINLDNLAYLTTTNSKLYNGTDVDEDGNDSSVYERNTTIHPLFIHSAALHIPIIAHSEKNSNDIKILNNNFYYTIHYWSHGVYALEWYRYYKYWVKSHNFNSKRFGVYIRDISGTRSYRIKLLDNLANINNNVHYNYQPLVTKHYLKHNTSMLTNWDTSTDDIGSDASAKIIWEDHEKFDIHIVAETLFDTHKTHLTEKVFKPIIMFQPFIIFSGPYSLQYMRNYGFKTFNAFWDESYDVELDSDNRFEKILRVITYINNLSSDEYKSLMNNISHIVNYNRNHFYSQSFEEILFNEISNGFTAAIQHQQYQFFNMPGGTIFYYLNLKYANKHELSFIDKQRLTNILQYTKTINPSLYTVIHKKYNKLCNLL